MTHLRILHTSDWQIGMSRRFLQGESQTLFDNARLDAVERLFELAAERDCDAVVVAGDVFDDNLVDRKTWVRTIHSLKKATVPIFLLPGNHDPFDAASVYRKPEFQKLSPEEGGKVIVLRDSEPYELRAGVEIIGAPLMSKIQNEDLVYKAVADLEPAGQTIRVVVGHGNTQEWGEGDDPGRIEVPRLVALANQRVIDYVALGDTHSHLKLDDRGVVRYSGAPEVTDYKESHGGGESNSGKVLIVDIEIDAADPTAPATVKVEEVQVGQWEFLAMEADVNSVEDAEQFLDRLRDIPNQRTTAIKYALRGTIDLVTSLTLDNKLAELRDGFAALYERERLMDLHVTPELDELREHLPLSGFSAMAMEDLLATAQGENVEPETSVIASDALKLLFRLGSDSTDVEA